MVIMYIGTGDDSRFTADPFIILIMPNTSNLANVMYSGSIIVLVGMTIMMTTHANRIFFPGNWYRAKP